MLTAAFLAAALSFAAVRALAPSLHSLLLRAGLARRNWRGSEVAAGIGIALPLGALVPWTWLALAGPGRGLAPVWIALIFGMSFLGFVDDVLGSREVSGFRGHIAALLAGRPTTGSLKALFGGLLALACGTALHGASLRAVLAAAVIGLSANALNLLDVRPGRALKGYVALWVLAGAAGWSAPDPAARAALAMAAALLGGAAALWKGDHRGRWMLGDAGANPLGASAGLVLAHAPLGWQLAVLALLLSLHLYAERCSLSDLIDSVPLLSRLDGWGR